MALELDAPNVVRQLRQHGYFIAEVGPFTNVWTPEQPRVHDVPMGFQQMPGRGTLEYTLDPDGDTIRLNWYPKGGSAEAPGRTWVGPIPITATPDYREAARRGAALACLIFVAFTVGGAAFGALEGSAVGGLGAGAVGGYFLAGPVWLTSGDESVRKASLDLRRAGPSQAQAPRRRRGPTALGGVYLVCALVVAAGFAIGFLVVSGSPPLRFLAGAIGIVVAMALFAVVTKLVRGGVAVKDFVRGRQHAK